MQNLNSIDQTVWPGASGQINTHRQTDIQIDIQTDKRIKREEYLLFFYKLVLNSGYGDSI